MGRNLKDFFFTFHICISQWNMSDKNYIQEGTEPKGLTTNLSYSKYSKSWGLELA